MTGLSPATLRFLHGLLLQVSLPVSSPDFESMAANAALAKRELAACLEGLAPGHVDNGAGA